MHGVSKRNRTWRGVWRATVTGRDAATKPCWHRRSHPLRIALCRVWHYPPEQYLVGKHSQLASIGKGSGWEGRGWGGGGGGSYTGSYSLSYMTNTHIWELLMSPFMQVGCHNRKTRACQFVTRWSWSTHFGVYAWTSFSEMLLELCGQECKKATMHTAESNPPPQFVAISIYVRVHLYTCISVWRAMAGVTLVRCPATNVLWSSRSERVHHVSTALWI